MESNRLAEILLKLMECCEYQQGLLEDLISGDGETVEETNENENKED